MSVRVFAVAVAACALLLVPATSLAAEGGKSARGTVTCNLPESDAESLVLLSNVYPGYWWDHTDLTIAVQAHPSATEEQLSAIGGAIETWSSTLEECFDGLITLTDVTGGKRKAADIVVHHVPTAGGVVFAAMRSAATTAARTSWSARTFRPARIAIPTTRNTWAG